MPNENQVQVRCLECDKDIKFRATPYRSSTQYVLSCDCEQYEIDVTECADDSSLLEPLSGNWSTMDTNSRMYSNDPQRE